MRSLDAQIRMALAHMLDSGRPLLVERTHPCRRRARFAGGGPKVAVRIADAMARAGLVEPDPTRAQPGWATYFRPSAAGRALIAGAHAQGRHTEGGR